MDPKKQLREHVASLMKEFEDKKGKIKNLQAFVTELVFKNGGDILKSPDTDSKFKEANVRQPQAKAIAGNIVTIAKLRLVPVLTVKTAGLITKELEEEKKKVRPFIIEQVAKLVSAFMMGRKGNPNEADDEE